MTAQRHNRRAVILESSLQFVKIGNVTQLIGRDVITNQDTILAIFDNVPFDPARLASNWPLTARLLGFNLIPSAPQSNGAPDHGEAFVILASVFYSIGLIGTFLALLLYMALRGIVK